MRPLSAQKVATSPEPQKPATASSALVADSLFGGGGGGKYARFGGGSSQGMYR